MENERLSLHGKETTGLPGLVSPRLHTATATPGCLATMIPHDVPLHFLNCNSEIVTVLSCGVLGYEVNRFTRKCVEPTSAQAIC